MTQSAPFITRQNKVPQHVQDIKDELLSPVERQVRQRDLGEVERGGERKKDDRGKSER